MNKLIRKILNKTVNYDLVQKITIVQPYIEAFITNFKGKIITKTELKFQAEKQIGVLSNNDLDKLLNKVFMDMARFNYHFAASGDDVFIIKPYYEIAVIKKG